jgi:subfamily B ATP-binding cassette protein MsbA
MHAKTRAFVSFVKLTVAPQDVEVTEGTISRIIWRCRVLMPRRRPGVSGGPIGHTGFIEQQPARFDAPVGEQGLSLSIGQRQRVGLARALLRDPDILIVDEAMSALDAALENRIRGNIEERFRSRTIVLITHRLETVLGVDDVVCIGEGKVLEEMWPRGAVEPPPGALRRFLARKRGAGGGCTLPHRSL